MLHCDPNVLYREFVLFFTFFSALTYFERQSIESIEPMGAKGKHGRLRMWAIHNGLTI